MNDPVRLATADEIEDLHYAATRCLDDLYFLITKILYYNDAHKYGPFHKWMCDTVGKVPGTRELWLLPRDHFKTTILTIGHAIQQLLRDPTQALLIVSRKDDHAFVWSDEMRRQFTSNERLRQLFPQWCAGSLNELGSTSEWTVPAYIYVTGHRRREPSVTVASMKGRKQSRHYNWVYPDDCMDKEDSSEVGLREIREDWKEIIPLIDRDGGVVACGTRKHYNDLYQAIMDTGIYKVYVRHGLESAKETCKEDECSRFALPHPAPDFKTGKPLEPARMTRKDYDSKLRECEIDAKLGQSFFWHEYMNIPFSPTDRVFQPSWFPRLDDAMIPGGHEPFERLSKWIAVDTAWKDEEHPTGYDFTVLVIGGFDDHGRLYILDILRSKTWTMKAGCEAIVTAMKAYGISRIIGEKVGEVTWFNFLRDRCRANNIPLQLLALTRGGRNQKSKIERIRGTQGYFEQGKVFTRKAAENYDDMVNEFCNLGRWTNDDIADAISMFFDERVIVRPLPQGMPATNLVPFRPMPFDGAARRGSFAAVNKSPEQSAAEFGRNGQVAVDGTGHVMFTPEQVHLFAERPDKKPAPAQFFRPFRNQGAP